MTPRLEERNDTIAEFHLLTSRLQNWSTPGTIILNRDGAEGLPRHPRLLLCRIGLLSCCICLIRKATARWQKNLGMPRHVNGAEGKQISAPAAVPQWPAALHPLPHSESQPEDAPCECKGHVSQQVLRVIATQGRPRVNQLSGTRVTAMTRRRQACCSAS